MLRRLFLVCAVAFFACASTTFNLEASAATATRRTDPVVPYVPIGAMIPYFGDQLPPAKDAQGRPCYVWADGQATWPDSAWVPANLRKKKVPNMNGLFPSGSNVPDESYASSAVGGPAVPKGNSADVSRAAANAPGATLSYNPDTLRNITVAPRSAEPNTIYLGMMNVNPGQDEYYQMYTSPGGAGSMQPMQWHKFNKGNFAMPSGNMGGHVVIPALTLTRAELTPPTIPTRWIIRLY